MLPPHLARFATAMAGVALLAACGNAAASSSSASNSGGAAAGSQVTEAAHDFAFDNTDITVQPGATVTITFTNQGSVHHNMTQSDLKIDQDAEPGTSHTITFTAPQSGSFTFHCEYHPTKMMGTITVAGSSAAAVPTPASSAAYTPYGY